MTLIDVCNLFSTDDRCRELLERLRWPNGPECLRCKSNKVVRLANSTKLLYCAECDYQFTVTANTIFHDSHLPLIKWLTCTYLLCEARKGMSANQIKRTLGVSYKTAWYLCHRIRAAMKEADAPMLDGTVEMDETYVGGRNRGFGRGLHNAGKPKQVVIGIRQRSEDGKTGQLRFFHAEDAKSGTLAKYIKEHISTDVDVILTDDFVSYPAALRESGHGTKHHHTIPHSKGVYAMGPIHTNTVESAFSLLKRGIVGSWHKVSAKHLAAYLDEMTFRFNRRKKSDLFLDTLRHMVTADPLTFQRLTA